MMKRVLIFLALLTAALSLDHSDANPNLPQKFTSPSTQTPLVELYTSEGCSSCPPAWKKIAALSQERRIWKDYVPVVFEVDYWDYLGWKDPYSKSAFTDLQKEHASEWISNHLQGSIYTPGFVLNGSEWRDWNSPTFSANNDKKSPGGVLVAEVSSPSPVKTEFKINFKNSGYAKQDVEIFLSLLGSGLTSKVIRGENNGETFKHDDVALNLIRLKETVDDKGEIHDKVILTKPTPQAAETLSFALWIVPRGSLKPIQALGGPLTDK